MRSIFMSFALALLLLAGVASRPPQPSARAHAAPDPQARFVGGVKTELVNGLEAAAGRVIVQFRGAKGVQARAASAASAALDAESNREVGGTGARLIVSRSKSAAELVAELSARPDVLHAEPDYVAYGGAAPNDPFYTQQYALNNTGQTGGTPGAHISAQAAWDISTGSNAQAVGVIDSGIDYNHPDLAPNVWTAPAPFSVTLGGTTFNCPAGSRGFNTINNTCDPLDDHNHGTHVSGIIGAAGNNGQGVAGVNWQTKLLALKWLNSNNSGFHSDALDALEVAVQLKQQGVANINVLNNSWFAGGSPASLLALLSQIQRVEAAGMLFVAIAGNGTGNNGFQNGGHDNEAINPDTGQPATPTYPSNFKTTGMLSVAATNSSDALAFFSNWGRTSVHLGAPGASIFSTLRNSNYGLFSGTSMAAPHVAGAAALLLSRCELTAAGMKGVLITTTDPVAALAGRTTSGGRLNAARALSTCVAHRNISDESRFYVRQHYVDFLGREPDDEGLAFWTQGVEACGADAACREVKRIDTSAAFFLSIEFQETGYLVYRTYQAAFGNIAPDKPVPVRFAEFLPDTQAIAQNVVVLSPGWEQRLEANKAAYFNSFVTRTRFTSAYPTTLSPAQFVDALFAQAGLTPTDAERQAAINEFGAAANTADAAARARALRRVAENGTLAAREFNRAFVLMQYFGYLRRNPDDAPEPSLDFTGYNFWLAKLEHFGGDYRAAEMVKAFISSDEYRQRFGPAN